MTRWYDNKKMFLQQNETCLDIAKRKNLVDIVQIIENPPARVTRTLQKQGKLQNKCFLIM